MTTPPMSTPRTSNACSGSGRRRREAHGDVLQAVDEVGAESLHLAGHLDVGEALQELFEEDLHLQASEVGAQTEVGAATAEGDVLVGGAAHVELVGVGE